MASAVKRESKRSTQGVVTEIPPADDGLDSVLFVDDNDNEDDEEEEFCHWEEGDDEEGECYYEDFAEDENEEEDEEEEEICPVADVPVAAKVSKRSRPKYTFKHEICVPDKDHKVGPVPKGKPWYLKKKVDPLLKRQDSHIAFNMPKQEDPEVLALRKTNKMVQKLMKYMRKSWKVRVDRKQDDRELEHRTLVSVYTKKPDDWQEQIRKREERSIETGFFSPLDVKYENLIDLELDTALLVFKNLPPDLKITAARWIRMKLRKEELKRKRDAYLPHVLHGGVKRPSFKKGRVLKDPGGYHKVDDFVTVAERFYKVTSGNRPFSKVLREWSEKKAKEGFNVNTGFGNVREGMFDFTSKPGSGGGRASGENNDDQADRRVSIVDARKYQRDMLWYEKFILAIYDIMKSLLNIRTKQLESKFPLPSSAVLLIRSHSPDTRKKKKDASALSTAPSVDSQFPVGEVVTDRVSLSKVPSEMAELVPAGESQENPEADPTTPAIPGPTVKRCVPAGEKGRLSQDAETGPTKPDIRSIILEKGVEFVKVEDLITMAPLRSTAEVVDDIKREMEWQDNREMKRKLGPGGKPPLTAEEKIKRLVENPEHAAIRRARNEMTYLKLFERNKKMKKPIWHDIDVAAMTFEVDEPVGVTEKDTANLTQQDAEEVVELALKKREAMERKAEEEDADKRWEFDIPTPRFPFVPTVVRIPSEEQSRRSLLKKTPHMNDVPGTPHRRLYKLAGVRTTEKDIFNNIMEMKKSFRVTENKVKIYYENEIGKYEWDTTKRFRTKLYGMKSCPVFQWTISLMRANEATAPPENGTAETEPEEEVGDAKALKEKRPALWYKKLREESEVNGALRHNGCHAELQKLLKYCDVDMKTKPHMLNRLALLVVSLPTTELATTHWQKAFVFLLEHMFGSPPELIRVWLNYRGLPYLL